MLSMCPPKEWGKSWGAERVGEWRVGNGVFWPSAHDDACPVVQILQVQALAPGEGPVYGDEQHTEDDHGLHEGLPGASRVCG